MAPKKHNPKKRHEKTSSQQENSLDPQEKRRDTGPDSAGQSGDQQGLAERAEADSESVEELVDEGQAWEGAFVSGVEDAEDADGNPREVRTHEVPEDDVPDEYTERDN